MAINALPLYRISLCVEIHIPRGGTGGFLPEIQRDILITRKPDNHKAAATQVARARENNGQGELCGNGCIHSVATLFHHAESGHAGQGMGRNNGAMIANHFLLTGIMKSSIGLRAKRKVKQAKPAGCYQLRESWVEGGVCRVGTGFL